MILSNDSLLNETESWQFSDLLVKNSEMLRVPEFDCSTEFLDNKGRVHNSDDSLTGDHYRHTSGNFFTPAFPVESDSDDKDSFVPCWSAVSEKSPIGHHFPPQRAQNSFKPDSYTLPQSAKMGRAQKRSLGLQKTRSSVTWLPDGCSHKLDREKGVSSVTELCNDFMDNKVRKSVGQSMTGELHFPSVLECERTGSLSRQMSIPVMFSDVAEYKHVFVTALQGWCLIVSVCITNGLVM